MFLIRALYERCKYGVYFDDKADDTYSSSRVLKG
jgi:hypothetical protein